jgi:hypothetical protein
MQPQGFNTSQSQQFALILEFLNGHEYRFSVFIHLNHNREEIALILARLNVHE